MGSSGVTLPLVELFVVDQLRKEKALRAAGLFFRAAGLSDSSDDIFEVSDGAHHVKVVHRAGPWALYDWASDRVVAYRKEKVERLGLFLGSKSAKTMIGDLREALELPETNVAGPIELTPEGFAVRFEERPYGYRFHRSVPSGYVLEVEGASGRMIRFESFFDTACALSPELTISSRQASALADSVAREIGLDPQAGASMDLQYVPLPGGRHRRLRCTLAYVWRFEGGEVWIDAEEGLVLGRHRTLTTGAYMSA